VVKARLNARPIVPDSHARQRVDRPDPFPSDIEMFRSTRPRPSAFSGSGHRRDGAGARKRRFFRLRPLFIMRFAPKVYANAADRT
jgi:hypothetical protein